MVQEEFLCQGRLNDPSLDLSLNNPLSQVSSLSVPYRWYLLGFLVPYFQHFPYKFNGGHICQVYVCGSVFKLLSTKFLESYFAFIVLKSVFAL
jgi:hypothetical protein